MPLLSDKEADKNSAEIQKGLAQLGGLGAGALAGAASSYPLDKYYQRKVLNQAVEDTRLQEHSEKRWRTLFDLYDGTLTLDDLPESEKATYQKLLADHKDELNYLAHRPEEKRQAMKNMSVGRVVSFNGNTKVPFTKNFPHKVKNPASNGLIGLAAIAGGYGAGAIYNHYNKPPDSDKKSFYKK